jgi:SCY1-like protein 1
MLYVHSNMIGVSGSLILHASRTVLAMIQPLFFIVENYSDKSKISKELGPLVALLFKVKDRGVRGGLLNKVDFMSQHLDKHSLNSHVFEPLCTGFNDSSPILRELTLKATLGLVPSLNQPNLEKLTRYLVRLQSDTETSIRTNSVIFVSKIAPQMSQTSREKHLLPAYTRSMKDTFPPARLAALQAVVQSKDLFSPADVATKVLPAVMPLLLDPLTDVRNDAFKVVNLYMSVLQEESIRMAQRQQQQQQQQRTSGASAAPPVPVKEALAPAPSSGSYMSGLTSWMGGSTQPTAAPAAPAPASMPQPPAMSQPPAPAPPVQQFASTSLAASLITDNAWGDDTDGWGDDDDDANDLAFSNIGSTTTPMSNPAPQQFGTPHQFDDDPFAAIGMKATGTGGAKLSLNKKKGGGLIIPKASVPAMKLSMDNDDLGDGWDDF